MTSLHPHCGLPGPQRFDRELAKLYRRLHRDPEPFSDDWQERFLATMVADPKFAKAIAILVREAIDGEY